MDSRESKPADIGAPKHDDIMQAFALSQRAFPAPAAPSVTQAAAGRLNEGVRRLGNAARYWLWRIKGRPRSAEALARHGMDQVIFNYEHDLARAHNSISALQHRLTECASSAARIAELEARAVAAEERATLAEEAARAAGHKIELLKDALDSARARANSPPTGPDTKFREVKRTFARLFHPDHGADPERTKFFQEFWPVIERIEKGE